MYMHTCNLKYAHINVYKLLSLLNLSPSYCFHLFDLLKTKEGIPSYIYFAFISFFLCHDYIGFSVFQSSWDL